MSALRITKIGVIDQSQQTHRDFAITAMEQEMRQNIEINYALYKQGNHALLSYAHSALNDIITEIMLLKCYKSA